MEIEKRVLIREYNEERDIQLVRNLEKKCEKMEGSKEASSSSSVFTNKMRDDPLCRIRFYPLHLMLVAELRENGELIGAVRGCIKHVGTQLGAASFVINLGCILGLRVSPSHRRMGIGLKLVKSIEEWLITNGAQYICVGTLRDNIASTTLFTSKCNYTNFTSLKIFVTKPTLLPYHNQNINIERLQIDQAICLYNNRLKGSKKIYPIDIDAILNEKLNLGTWVAHFKEEKWVMSNEEIVTSTTKTPSSWIIFSVWNSVSDKFYSHSQSIKSLILHFICKLFSLDKPLGFLFVYGVYGEGERLEELMKCIWGFVSRLAQKNVKKCKVIVSELGVLDPIIEYVPREACMSCIHDMWYLKKVEGVNDVIANVGHVGNVFVDPRDF